MFTPEQKKVIAKLLYVALSYNSREGRVRALLNHTDLDIRWAAETLKYDGYITSTGIELNPK